MFSCSLSFLISPLFHLLVLLFVLFSIIVFLAEVLLFIPSEQLFYILKIFFIFYFYLSSYPSIQTTCCLDTCCAICHKMLAVREVKKSSTDLPFNSSSYSGKIQKPCILRPDFCSLFEVETNCVYVWEYIKYGNEVQNRLQIGLVMICRLQIRDQAKMQFWHFQIYGMGQFQRSFLLPRKTNSSRHCVSRQAASFIGFCVLRPFVKQDTHANQKAIA